MALAGEFAAAAGDLAKKDESAAVIAIVVNRVALARAVRDALARAIDDADAAPAADVTLLIGPTRPLERDRLLRDLLPRLRAGRATGEGRRLYVVATQCVEAGADLDFDALVTQIAPLDCLRQRFGRLDRLGTRHMRGRASHAVILATAGEIAKNAIDPIYGTAVARTWAWLVERGGKGKGFDFGIEHLEPPVGADLAALLAPRASAPVLLPAYVDAWTQTSPAPGADPEVSLFLHGPDAGPADVQIVWRADLEEDDLRDGAQARDLVAVCPPSSLEAVSVPLAAARRWLAKSTPAEIADVEGAAIPEPDERLEEDRCVLRWQGPDHARTIGPEDLRPGDLIVVPAAYGGCDAFGWNPKSKQEVSELGFEASLRQRHRLVLRLSERLLKQALESEAAESEQPLPGAEFAPRAKRLWRRIGDAFEQWHDAKQTLVAELAALGADLPAIWRRALEFLDGRVLGCTVDLRDPTRPGRGAALALRRRLRENEVGHILGDGPIELSGAAEPATEDDAGSIGRAPVALLTHGDDVETLARAFASGAGFAAERVENIALAARLHDLGKAESRFQIWLRGGDELAWLRDETLLAKSDARASRAEIQATRRRARLPAQARHECWSVWLAEQHPALAQGSDRDLVLWLIGTHHGHGRPFFPPVAYPDASEELQVLMGDALLHAKVEVPLCRLDSGWVERFESLKLRYGPWELARMEAILRLADHRASEHAELPMGGEEASP